MKLIHIAAMDRNQCIGSNGNLPWYLPKDLAFFKQFTLGKSLVVGNTTFKTLPKKVSEGRTLHVVSRSKGDQLTTEHLLDLCDSNDELVVIGGSEVYAGTLHLADELLITEVDLEVDGDKYYPPFLDTFKKVYTSDTFTENEINFRFTKWIPKANNTTHE